MRCGRALGMLGVVVAVVVGFGSVGTAPALGQSPHPATVRFTDAAPRELEGRQQVHVIVERTDLPVSRLLVHYRTQDGTGPSAAVVENDYVHTAGTLVFEVGVRASSFRVTLRDDDVAEETEHLLLHLETSSGSTASTRLFVLDDDLAPSEISTADAPPASPVPAPERSTAAPAAAPPPVVVATSAGVRRPIETRARPRAVAARPAAPQRIILRQTPAAPFELRPSPGSASSSGLPTAVDPILALAAGLLLARVAAEAWFRARFVAG